MKKIATLILICCICACLLCGCGKKAADSASETVQSTEPVIGMTQVIENGAAQDETKSVTLEELLADVDDEETEEESVSVDSEFNDELPSEDPAALDSEIGDEAPVTLDSVLSDEAPVSDDAQTAPDDVPITPSPSPTAEPPSLDGGATFVTASPQDNGVAMPFATSTPQPNAIITAYSQCSGTGLGFKFNYPTGWKNIPGRSTICYVQPTENGTVYPARVAVTMKKLAHRCTDDLCKNELVEFLKLIRTQYDASTFEVDSNLNVEQKFMKKNAMSTTYLAYDGQQEIAGYVIITYFERYLFTFHFQCAYEDYAAFQPAIGYMRDSVAADG